MLGDSAYGTGVMLAALTDAGHVPVIQPWPVHVLIHGGFTAVDFAVDENAGTVTCPAGQTVGFTPGSGSRGSRIDAPAARCAHAAPPAPPDEP